MEKILVTGANGFLGSNLVRQLSREGYAVRAMIRPGANLAGMQDIPCEIFYGNIDNAGDADKAVEGCKLVVHAAAITRQWAIAFEEYERINFTGTKNIAEACIKHKVDKLIYVSTANTIGPGNRHRPGTELDSFTLFKANSAYISTKYLAQQFILEQVEKRKLPAIVVNPTFMIGPNDIKPSSGKLMLYALNRRLLFYPPGGKNFVYIKDVCDGIISAMHRGVIGSCYLLAGHNMSYKRFFQLVSRAGGKSAFLIGLPAIVVKFLGILAPFIGKITGREARINFTIAYLSCMEIYYSGKKSERELFVKYTSMEEAINKSLAWFKENNYY